MFYWNAFIIEKDLDAFLHVDRNNICNMLNKNIQVSSKPIAKVT